MDGWVVIGVKGDTKQLKKDLNNSEKLLQKYEQEAEKLTQKKIKIEFEIEGKGKELDRKIQEIQERAEIKKIGLGRMTGDDLQKREKIDAMAQVQINELTKKYNEYLDQANDSIQNIDSALEQNLQNQYMITSEVAELNKKVDESKAGFLDIDKTVRKVGGGIGKVVKKVGMWALAMFGIRSAYTGIRSLISQVSQYNEQIKTDMDYMRYAVAVAFTPVVKYLVKLFYSILINVRNIIQSLTGFNIFAKSGAKGFKEANKQAKELKKQLMGFDEVNVLSDTSDNATKGPQLNLAQDNDVMVKGISGALDKVIEIFNTAFEKIKNNVEKVLRSIGFSDLLIGSVRQMMYGVQNVVEGVLKAVSGAIDLVIGLVTGNTDMAKEAFVRLIEGIGQILWGLVNHWVGMVTTMYSIIHDTFVRPVMILMGSMYDAIVEIFGKIGVFFVNTFTTAWTKIKKLFSTGGQIFVGIKDGIVNVFKTIVNGLISGINTAIQTPFNKINELLNAIRSASILGVKPFSKMWNKNPISVPKIPKLKTGAILNLPGTGVPIASTGESGREGILPLTDAQAMSELGYEIGKHVIINNMIDNYIDSRRINRVLAQSRDADSYANNGGVA